MMHPNIEQTSQSSSSSSMYIQQISKDNTSPRDDESIIYYKKKHNLANKDKWKKIKDKIYCLTPSNEEDSLSDAMNIANLISDLNNTQYHDEIFGDNSTKQYYINEFIFNIAKYLINNKSFKTKEFLEISNTILDGIVFYWLKIFHEDNVKLAETCRIILDPIRTYYKINNQEDITSSYITSSSQKVTKEHYEWIKTLKEGNLVDAIYVDTYIKKVLWLRAKVGLVLENHLQLNFIGTKENSNRYIEKITHAHEIAKLDTKAIDFDWRMSLKTGDLIDACDSINMWVQSIVISAREVAFDDKQPYKEILVGFRDSLEKNEKMIEENKKYFSWNQKNDEWILVTSPRIQKRGKMTKKSQLGSMCPTTDDQYVDDSNDHAIFEEDRQIFAVTRNSHCKSTFLVDLINRFGEKNGFALILDRISDTKNWANIDLTSALVGIVGNMYAVLHRDFVQSYIPKLKDALWNNLLKSPEANVRNFSREKIDTITGSIEPLLKRIYTIQERQEVHETFMADISILCLDSNFLERKLQGLKMLMDIMKNIKFNTYKYITGNHIVDFIEKNNVFEKIYGSKGHTQLLQRSSDFLRYFLNDMTLEQKNIELIWTCTKKGDMEAKLGIYKIISDISHYFKPEHITYFLSKMNEIPPQDLIKEEIELVYELGRFSNRPADYMEKSRIFFWRILNEKKYITQDMIDLALNRFCEIMKYSELKDDRYSTIIDCLANIEKGISVLSSIKIIKKLIDNYPSSTFFAEKLTKTGIVDHLVNEKNLVIAIINEIKTFKSNLKQKLSEFNTNEVNIDQLTGERSTYANCIAERLQFAQFLLSNGSNDKALTYDLLCAFWDIIVETSLIKNEGDVLCKWLKDVFDSKASPISNEDLRNFFQNKLTNSNFCGNMTNEGFNCFKLVFLLINERFNNIIKYTTGAGTSVTSFVNSINGTSYVSYSYSHDDAKPEFEYKINVLPEQLEGIDSLWDLIFTVEEDAVMDLITDFLNKIYLYQTQELEKDIVIIRNEYLSRTIKYFHKIIEQKVSLNEAHFVKYCTRALYLIRSLLDESEKRGIGNLKSHSALVKGELMNINMNNELTSGSDVPKKTEIRIYSNSTIYELRVEIAKNVKATWDQVKILRSGQQEVKDSDNGKTISELRIRNGEILTVQKRPTPPIPQANLINQDGTLTPMARKVFVEWFDIFSTNGKMSQEQCAAFINSCTNDGCKTDDRRVRETFQQYDNDKDGYLTVENFLEFYTLASKTRSSVVWNNLYAHHYRNDLKKVTEVEEEVINTETLPRYLFSRHREYFSLIFYLLDYGGKLSTDAWKLLNRLPTSPLIYNEIVSLKGVRGTNKPDWEHILDSESAYKLLYSLHIIEYLMEDDELGNDNSHGIESDEEIKDYIHNWRSDFILYGGFDHLMKIFDKFLAKSTVNLSSFDKNVIAIILKILKNYATALFSINIPNMFKAITFVKTTHLPLEFYHKLTTLTLPQQESKIIETDQKDNSTIKHKDSIDLIEALLRKDSFSIVNEKDHPKKQENPALEEEKKEKLKFEETEDFKGLVIKLKGDLGNHMLEKINPKSMINLAVALGSDILNSSAEIESEDRLLIEYSLSILIALLLYDKNLITTNFFGHNQSVIYIVEGIFCTKSLNIRKYFSHALYVLSKETLHYQNAYVSKLLINLLLSKLPDSRDEMRHDCNQYFDLLCKLIDEVYSRDENNLKIKGQDDQQNYDFKLNFEELIVKIILQIKNHEATEKRTNNLVDDKILIGLLNLCEQILNVQPHLKDIVGDQSQLNFVEEIFGKVLFDVSEDNTENKNVVDFMAHVNSLKNSVKCKGNDSRKVAYKLLNSLCHNSTKNTLILIKGLNILANKLPKIQPTGINQWNHSPQQDFKSYYGFAGLRNLGCICYMNAMLQQFYMTPTFRYGILMADDQKPPNLVKKDDKYTIDDNVFHQLQKMFGFLDMTDRLDYNPHEFCFSFKDYTGNPVNVSIQQDTQEFLNMIFDKLEFGLKHTPFRYILESVYGGKTCTQLICSSCNKIRDKHETFYNLSVEVKNLKTIYDSFDKFISGETIEDYHCEDCQKRVNTTKRCCISELPNVLIIHLQRIVFNLDTLMNEKINSKLEFPHDLNLEPYTKEGLESRENAKNSPIFDDQLNQEPNSGLNNPNGEKSKLLHDEDYYNYRLVGVVVHSGTADFGHYYSYINTNRENIENKALDKWLEFNDSSIRHFDIKNLENECFGGASNDNSDDNWGWSKGRDSSKNAYILVYERIKKVPLKLVVQNENELSYLKNVIGNEALIEDTDSNEKIKENTNNTINNNNNANLKEYLVDYYKLKKYVPETVFKKVWEDNQNFMFERHIFNEEFFKFIKEIANGLNLPDITPENTHNFMYHYIQNISQDKQEIYNNLINFNGLLIFHILSRAHDNNCIIDLTITLKKLLSINPQSAYNFFDMYITKDPKRFLDILLTCPDKHVRECISQILVHLVNVIIYYHELNLNLEYFNNGYHDNNGNVPHNMIVYENIIKFLNLLISILPTDVAKNWVKFQQYFDFWRDFTLSGEQQLYYLFQKQFISVLIDFYLDKKSPLIDFQEKKYSLGNRFSDPVFSPLIQIVSLMLRRTKMHPDDNLQPRTFIRQENQNVFELSECDKKCLSCNEFYDKTMREKHDPTSLGVIIEHLCYENHNFSFSLCQIMLRGINKATHDDAPSYLEAIAHFLNINDSFTNRRIEWILGQPQPNIVMPNNELISFGIYGNLSLDDNVIIYETPINPDEFMSLLKLMIQSKRRFENLVIVCMKYLLYFANINRAVFEYLITLPGPCYAYNKYTDWFLQYIDQYISDARRYYTSYSKEQLGLEVLKFYKLFETRLEEKLYKEQNNQTTDNYTQNKRKEEYIDHENNNIHTGIKVENLTENSSQKAISSQEEILPYVIKPYIIGKIIQENECGGKEYLIDDSYKVYFLQSEVVSYITESKPTGKNNLAFPPSTIKDGLLVGFNVKNSSPLAYFIQPKGQTSSNTNNNLKYDNDQYQDKSDEESNYQNGDAQDMHEIKKKITTEPFLDDFTFTFEKNNIVRRFVLANNSPFYLNICLQIKPRQIGEFLNFRIPLSPIWMTIKPKSNAQIFAMHKIFPQSDWGEYDVSLDIEKSNNNNNNGGSGMNSPNKINDRETRENGSGKKTALSHYRAQAQGDYINEI